MIAVADITLRNDDDDIVVLVDPGDGEPVEVIRERGKFGVQAGSMDHTISSLGINDVLIGRMHEEKDFEPDISL
jgi:hypothetical protein